MTLAHPEVKRLIAGWQEELRLITGNRTLILTCLQPPRDRLDFNTISKIVCDATGVPFEKIRQRNRKREIVVARQILVYYCTLFTDMSLSKIGLVIGGKDHSSVIHCKKKVLSSIETGDLIVCGALEKVNKMLQEYKVDVVREAPLP